MLTVRRELDTNFFLAEDAASELQSVAGEVTCSKAHRVIVINKENPE